MGLVEVVLLRLEPYITWQSDSRLDRGKGKLNGARGLGSCAHVDLGHLSLTNCARLHNPLMPPHPPMLVLHYAFAPVLKHGLRSLHHWREWRVDKTHTLEVKANERGAA